MRALLPLSLALSAGSSMGLLWLGATGWPGVALGAGLGLGLAGLALRFRSEPAPVAPTRVAPLAPPSSPVPRPAPRRVLDEVEVIHADELLAAEAEARADRLSGELAEARHALEESSERLLALEGLRQRAVADYELQLQHSRRELARARDALGAEIARRVRTEDELRQSADSDLLTGLVSPRIFIDRANMAVAQAQRHGGRLGVVVFAVDGFAEISDSLGRSVGDDLLRSIATLLTQSLRQVDTVSRLAGDEFSLLLPGLKEPEDALRVAEKLRLVLCNPLGLGAQDLLVTASLGIALYPEDGPDTDALLDSARAAARQVRAAGGDGCRLHAPQSAARAAERARLESELRRALVTDELLLHYQPVQDCASGRLCGVEAFLRWRRPAGLIDAGEFLGLADSTGLTLPLGQWALQTATRCVQRWRREGLVHLGVTVNVSGRQLDHPALPSLVARALDESGLPAAALALELPEADLLRLERPGLRERLQVLRASGVRVILGNFGLGESSLRRLERLPLDGLKIDRTVVAGLASDGEHERLARSAVALARTLGLQVGADGVDTEPARARLLEWGCDLIQGRVLSLPLAEDECQAFLVSLGAPPLSAPPPSAPPAWDGPTRLAPSRWPWLLLTAPPPPPLLGPGDSAGD